MTDMTGHRTWKKDSEHLEKPLVGTERPGQPLISKQLASNRTDFVFL